MSLKAEEDHLVAEALKGAPYAWETLVRRYEGRVYNFGLRLTGSESDALDLMQEVFIGVYRNLHRFRSESMFSTWLFRIAHNKAIDLIRKNKPHLEHSLSDMEGDDFLPPPLVEDAQPLEQLIAKQQNAKVRTLLDSLSWEQRLLVELKVFQSHTFEDIAELENISINTVKTRFYTALRTLKKLLESSHDL
jgi:RNA polymerase sigma-70 factor (ECF subfamily)